MKILFIALSLLALSLSGCEEQGPAERLGEGIDQVADDIGSAAEDTCEEVTNRPC